MPIEKSQHVVQLIRSRQLPKKQQLQQKKATDWRIKHYEYVEKYHESDYDLLVPDVDDYNDLVDSLKQQDEF